MVINILRTITHSPEETKGLGEKLAERLREGDIVALLGELGSGKTTIIQGIVKGLGGPAQSVSSPSFVILKQYKGRFLIYHFDLYRIKDFSELIEVGYPDFFYTKGVVLIEWAEKVEEHLKEYMKIKMEYISPQERRIEVSMVKKKTD
ncbi:MAG: tRNA (adenosine(37)-N6)-threonylcarbamoyltransferase complex ATPase subunit type 1 TsaE [Candidatus Omnitrophota bacterium]|nr:MAG: tRNA (adenosine(37)-N6)-threonylcarbamoyltransferase complex ATPase subunit type 1 TsaE [Candidatus Omnitrophota bacterium]